MEMVDKRLQKIVSSMLEKHHCHTVILYGSHARNEATETSDYDIIAIREMGEVERDCQLFDGAYLDAFIYSEEVIQNPDESLIRIKDGIVLCEKEGIGDQLLKRIQERFLQGPRKLPDWDKQVIITWSQKMFHRAKVGDIEGNYRRHWLSYDLLEAYFHLRDQWYLGPKEAFQWLKANDPGMYTLFDIALNPDADLTDLKRCIERVVTV